MKMKASNTVEVQVDELCERYAATVADVLGRTDASPYIVGHSIHYAARRLGALALVMDSARWIEWVDGEYVRRPPSNLQLWVEALAEAARTLAAERGLDLSIYG